MTERTAAPSFAELVRVSARIGFLSFGGPVGQIALMHREFVEDRAWVSEDQYLHALNFCHLLPGPEAQQLAIWIGWKLHGLRGGLAAGLLFVIPGALVILALSILYGFAASLGWFAALFLGIKSAVLAIVVQALLRVAGRALNTSFKMVVAGLAFAALFFFNLPFPLVVLSAGLAGTLVAAQRPSWLRLSAASPPMASSPRPWGASARAIVIGGIVWLVPLVLVYAALGPHHVLWKIGSFFSRLAVVSFGGAYAVLAYMAQEAVQSFGWLSAGEMADGLGLAETTPGPLIMVTQFVGYLAALRAPAPFSPLTAGVLGALLTTWVTFAPCFLWIFALSPWIERLENAQRLKGGLASITAAIVGVIANLSVWFALHVLFTRVEPVEAGPARFFIPLAASFDWRAAVLAGGAAFLAFRLRWNVISVIGLAATGGLVLGQFA
jgi:chromate transporter